MNGKWRFLRLSLLLTLLSAALTGCALFGSRPTPTPIPPTLTTGPQIIPTDTPTSPAVPPTALPTDTPISSPPATPTFTPIAAFLPGDETSVTAANLNVRSGPGVGFNVLWAIPRGTVVVILEGPQWVGASPWYRVRIKGTQQEGWCNGKYLTRYVTPPITYSRTCTAPGPRR